jgi:primosomal replication protein N
MYTQDINELTISGHVNAAPRLQGDPDELLICEFVLTHTTHAYDRHGWEQQHYNVTAYGPIAQAFADRHQAGQVIVITGALDLQLRDTLIGPLPYVSITAQRIITVDGTLNPAAHSAAPTIHDIELQQTAIGPVPHTRADR